ncbi:hypothetical protein CYMTET_38239 [Cymbomonas tetramitiformis]|uniref:Uncharacterized protein n=1 Tax=Cymbomonas tetramitiformis TaxID=36881 RepID=A0AAE0CEM7_9CHLO|nr:hypothetical protein CYMTET_38239 [Cymbomonas tetramitiformis]
MTSTRTVNPQYAKTSIINCNSGNVTAKAPKAALRAFTINRPCHFNAAHSRRLSRPSGRASQITWAMDAAAPAPEEGAKDEYEVIYFPRIKERDCWRCLGVSQDATYEEIQDARNYLVDYHKTHIEGVEAIEAAFDKVISQKLKQRKKDGKINISKKKEVAKPAWQENFMARFQKPSQQIMMQRAAVYVGFIVWSLYQSASTGPAFQVLAAFALTVYFLVAKRGDRTKTWGALGNTLVALVGSWIVGTVVPVYAPFLFPAAVRCDLTPRS